MILPLRPLGLALAVLLAGLSGAEAHRLRLFATVTGDTVSGYAFFVGGGRPQGVPVTVRDASGAVVATITTDAGGAFSFRPDPPGALTLSVNAGDGHAATTTLAADRFSPAPIDATSALPAPIPSAPGSAPTSGSAVPALPPTELEALITRAVEQATRPLLEAQAEAEARIRFNDVMGGIGMLVGLTGVALWASSRRRDRRGPPGPS